MLQSKKLKLNLCHKRILVVVFLFTSVTILFLPVILGWRGIFHDDQAMEEFSRYYFVARNLQRGIIPLWDPQTWCGAIPFYARYYANTYYIPLWPFFLLANLNNLNHAYWLLILIPLSLHYLLAVFGMYLFLRRVLKVGYIASCFGALAYIYSPTFAYAYVWQPVVTVQAWLPWLLTIYISVLQQWRYWKVLLAGVIFAFILTAAAPTLWPFIAFIWGSIIILQVIFLLRSSKKLKIIFKPVLIAFVIAAIGVCLSSVYLFSFFDGMQYTQEHTELSADAALNETVGSLPPVFLSTLFVPNLFDNITGTNIRFLNPSHKVLYWEANLTGGMAVSLLVLLGIVLAFKMPAFISEGRRRRWYVLVALFLYIFAILCVLGRHTPFYRYAIGYLPAIGQLPRPIRYRFIQCFMAAVLAAAGLENLVNSPNLSKRYNLRFWIWLYIVFSFFIVTSALLYPLRSKQEISYEWSGNLVSSVSGYFSSAYSVCMYSPACVSRKIRVFFDGESAGEIRYADNKNIPPTQGALVANYRVSGKGWHEFDVDIPPHKYAWIYQKYGNAKIGYKRLGLPIDSYFYDNYEKNWVRQSYSNAIWFYQEKQRPISSLVAKLKDKSVLSRLIGISVFYWILVTIALIFSVHYLFPRSFGYFVGLIALAEFFVFGLLAFYGNSFSYDSPVSVKHPRALSPSVHTLVQRMAGPITSLVTNPTLRIATDRPYYDNFVRLKGYFTLMGYEMHPLETRFKRAIEAAYEQIIDWSFYHTLQQPSHIPFLNHFSVGFFLNRNPNSIFLEAKAIPLPDNSDLYIHINPNALPHAFTLDRLTIASEEEQLTQLVSGDLRQAVYLSPSEGLLTSESIIEEDAISHFANLQQDNHILKFNLDNPNCIDIDIQVSKSSMLVLTEVWYPGWSVTVDGQPRRIYRVNYCQRGVWLEKGKHNVQFRFKPLAWQSGLIISLGTMVLLLGIGLITIIKNRLIKKSIKNS